MPRFGPSAFPRGQDGGVPVALHPTAYAELMTSPPLPVLVEPDAGAGSSIDDSDLRRHAAAEIVPAAADAWAAGARAEGEGTARRRVRVPPSGSRAVHVSPPRGVPEGRRRVARVEDHGDRVRDGATRGRHAAAARTDERGRRAGWRRRSARTSSSAATAAGACCSAARPACGPARVVVLGAGNVGSNAAWIAQGMEAEVLLLDRNIDRLRWVDQIHRGRIMTLASNRGAVGARRRRRGPRHRRGARPGRPRADARHRRHDPRR